MVMNGMMRVYLQHPLKILINGQTQIVYATSRSILMKMNVARQNSLCKKHAFYSNNVIEFELNNWSHLNFQFVFDENLNKNAYKVYVKQNFIINNLYLELYQINLSFIICIKTWYFLYCHVLERDNTSSNVSINNCSSWYFNYIDPLQRTLIMSTQRVLMLLKAEKRWCYSISWVIGPIFHFVQ